ncbi:MAG: arginine deiminase-related protein [Pirellulaceae bacterium]|nr:arginine deiminase-related protein [Pirellulaceae bacterium]
MSKAQITNKILMIRPANFGFNSETATSNSFQTEEGNVDRDEIAQKAIKEFDAVLAELLRRNVDVFAVEDTPEPVKPDAVFPNNWISFHEDGQLVVYPMMSRSRRQEIREDIIEGLQSIFEVNEVWRMDQGTQGENLEGTGSMVLDRANRIAYACRSLRTSEKLFQEFCQRFEFRPVMFDAYYTDGLPIYHTNVILALTKHASIVCLEAINDPAQAELVRNALSGSGKAVLEIDLEQVGQFAANMLQIEVPNSRPILLLSETALPTLSDGHLQTLKEESDIVNVSIPTIEKYGGGSIRCMLAEIFSRPRDAQ